MPSYPTPEIEAKITGLEKEIDALKRKLYETKRASEPMPVKNYSLVTQVGQTTLSEMFGEKKDLIVIHNMGKSCSYCTMWADGIQGLLHYLDDRASLWMVSPDDPQVQKEFAESRSWTMKMASDGGPGEFTKDLGYHTEKDGYWPGASAFKKNPDGTITRTAQCQFGPMDDFCAAWPLFELLEGGAGDWEPRYLKPRS